MTVPDSFFTPRPYVPSSLSEIYDTLGSMILGAPTFIDRHGDFPDRNIDSEYSKLTQGFGLVRKTIGEERYSHLIDLAARSKDLFAADQDDTNGKTDQGLAILQEIEDIIQAARRGRVKAKLADEDGEVTGD